MKLAWTDDGWADYLYWQSQDKKTLKRINMLIEDIQRNGSKGLGKTETLRCRKGYSKRIDEKNRLVFDILNEEIVVISCRGHYED